MASSSTRCQPRFSRLESKWIRTIGCISTGRADAGIYRPLLTALAAERDWQVFCFAGGTHHVRRFGLTVKELSDLAGVQVVSVKHFVPGDSPLEVAATAGRATERFGEAFEAVRPDLVFVLGDRTEMLAATLAALIHRIPIAHLHGGDATEGAYDDQCRGAITKLSNLHFPALQEHADRIIAMGEEPWRVIPVGALALDAIGGFMPEPLGKLSKVLGLDFRRRVIVVAFHPETLSDESAAKQMGEVLAGVRLLDADLLLIGPNSDVEHLSIWEMLADLARTRPRTKLAPSLSQTRFWSCMVHASTLVGNSSAGLIEAASFGLPVVNVGDRQKGRVRAANVIDVPARRAAIAAAIRRVLNPSFRPGLAGLVNPYGDGRAAERIIAALRRLPDRQTLLHKHL